MYVTFLAGIFRSVRFGIKEAHGRGMALQFNYLIEEGAIVHDATSGTFRVDFDEFAAGRLEADRRDHDDPGEGGLRPGEGVPRTPTP